MAVLTFFDGWFSIRKARVSRNVAWYDVAELYFSHRSALAIRINKMKNQRRSKVDD